MLNKPKTPGKASNIPDQHVDLQYQPNAKCSAIKIGFVVVGLLPQSGPNGRLLSSRTSRKKRQTPLWPLGRERPEDGRDRKPHSGNERNGSMAASVLPIVIRNLVEAFSCAVEYSVRARTHKPRCVALKVNIETCASRKADKEDKKAVQIAVYYLARGMQVFGYAQSSCWAYPAQQLEAVAGSEVSGA
ncbi:hypothetical protein [Bradyrhizobium vignae]|uniref:hypothetical protein n=1 Tax=Bradyrhizobium vignae TaxID=1549949 RepID=UPI0011AE2C16|nr:hypothetical protein [Bradyrhizobium vignae]